MKRLLKRALLSNIHYSVRRDISFLLQHEKRKVNCLGGFRAESFLRKQSCRSVSQKIQTVSLDDPSLQKYLSAIISRNGNHLTDESLDKRFPKQLPLLTELLNQRELVLNNIKAVKELQQGGEEDQELKALAKKELTSYQNELGDLDDEILKVLVPRNKFENYSEIMMEVSSGAGGQEAMLFANELVQLYENYASLRGWNFSVASVERSGLGGIKNASIFIHGDGAFYYMQNEIGVHRVQRIPITSTANLIHTSTAAVIVMPQPSDVDVQIADKDLVIEFTRASGPGGQNVNKSESAVRIKHLPTGLTVECQEEKSAHRNKDLALRKLRTKLYDIETQKQDNTLSSTRRSQLQNRERSAKIRTYNVPQNRVTDHRGHITVHNIKEVLEGRLVFHNFLEKLNEQHENQLILQFVSNIQQNFNS